MNRLIPAWCAVCLLLTAPVIRAEPAPPHSARVEARSADLLAVGVVQGARMSIHISRLSDNAPVRDAVLTVLLRGAVHPTLAEADGGYALTTPDLEIPGDAAVTFHLVTGASQQDLKGTLTIPQAGSRPAEPNSARQLWWWVLNFAVCIGFLMLFSRRRKAAARDDS